MAGNRHSRRYLLPNCYQIDRYRNDVQTKWVQGAEPWGDQPSKLHDIEWRISAGTFEHFCQFPAAPLPNRLSEMSQIAALHAALRRVAEDLSLRTVNNIDQRTSRDPAQEPGMRVVAPETLMERVNRALYCECGDKSNSASGTGPQYPLAGNSGGRNEYTIPELTSRYQFSTCGTTLLAATGISSISVFALASSISRTSLSYS